MPATMASPASAAMPLGQSRFAAYDSEDKHNGQWEYLYQLHGILYCRVSNRRNIGSKSCEICIEL